MDMLHQLYQPFCFFFVNKYDVWAVVVHSSISNNWCVPIKKGVA